jgi:hypothetical protein
MRSEVIWAETAFPGVRAWVQVDTDGGERSGAGDPTSGGAGHSRELRIDVGFGDPMDPPPDWIDYPAGAAGPARVLACRPETLLAWKTHGLFERGKGRWRPKDLFDIYLLAKYAPLDRSLLPRAIRLAFESRGDSIALASKLVAGDFGKSPWSLEKWARFRASRPGGVPENVAEVVGFVADTLRPLLEAKAPCAR